MPTTPDGWRKSSFSAGDGNCVELKWRKADYSKGNSNCVELADAGSTGVMMRNSRHPDGAQLRFTPMEMDAFIRGVKAGEFDDLMLAG